MGAGRSSLNGLKTNNFLIKLVSPEVIPISDAFWNQMLAFQIKLPNTISDNRLLEESTEDLLKTLLHNNLSTGNISTLIQIFLIKATELKASLQLENKLFITDVLNALFIIRSVVKFLIESLGEDEVIRYLQILAKNDTDKNKREDMSGLVEVFVCSLVEIIVDVPLIPFTRDLHIEATSTLIVLCSSHIFAVASSPRYLILRTLVSGKSAIHACLLTKTLISRVIASQDRDSNAHSSLVVGLASGIWNVFKSGLAAPEADVPLSIPTLSRLSLLLTLVLTNHFACESTVTNPYRIAILNAQNIQESEEPIPTEAVATFKIDYSKLFSTFQNLLSFDHVTLLLYLLLHKNANFRNYVLSRTDIENLVIPVLQTLYNTQDKSSHHVYMSLIILLILSEDESYNKIIHDIKLKNVSWYTEKYMSEVSLGGLLILVVIRTITHNMSKMRDKYLHTNCLAALANMSSQFRDLHPFVCQKMVNLFSLLAKRHEKLTETLKQIGCSIDSNEVEISEAINDLSVVDEVLRMVFEILNSTLINNLSNNHNLVYALLYQSRLFEHFSNFSNFRELSHNIEIILNFLMRKLEKTTSEPSVADVQEVIKEGVMQLPRDSLIKMAELKFRYVEESEPEEFFVPYVWMMVFSSSNLFWNTSKVTLFDPSISDR